VSVNSTLRRAFSLIELLIVIVIVGVIYTLAITRLSSVGEEKKSPSFLNLKEYLSSYLKEGDNEVRLLCLDDCSECFVFVDGEKREEIESFLDPSVERYRYDFLEGVVNLGDEVYFNDDRVQEDVCFSFSMQRNKVSEQMIVVYKDKAYDYTTFFTPTKEYNSIEDIIDAKEALRQEVMQ